MFIFNNIYFIIIINIFSWSHRSVAQRSKVRIVMYLAGMTKKKNKNGSHSPGRGHKGQPTASVGLVKGPVLRVLTVTSPQTELTDNSWIVNASPVS